MILWLFFQMSFSSVQFSRSVVSDSETPWIAARQTSLSITNSRSSLRFTSIESVMPSSHLILCRPLLLLPQSLPASESFPMSQLFAWGGQSTGVSALASFLPKKSQGLSTSAWSPPAWSPPFLCNVSCYCYKSQGDSATRHPPPHPPATGKNKTKNKQTKKLIWAEAIRAQTWIR